MESGERWADTLTRLSHLQLATEAEQLAHFLSQQPVCGDPASKEPPAAFAPKQMLERVEASRPRTAGPSHWGSPGSRRSHRCRLRRVHWDTRSGYSG
jgi:hypothetical protein